jgi:flagellar protein FlbD
MINLTRLNHQTLVVNCDLIKFIENAPDTVLTLTNGEKIVVRENVDEVIRRVIAFRRSLLEGLPTLGVDPHTTAATAKLPTESHPTEHGRFHRG